MFKKIKTVIMTLSALLVLAAPAALPTTAFAAASASDPITCGLGAGSNLDATGANCNVDPGGTNSKLNTLLTNVVNLFSIVVGVVAVIMIIFGGFRYITSGGESSKVSGAKNSIIYAIVGLVIVALAQFIVHYVLAKATNLT